MKGGSLNPKLQCLICCLSCIETSLKPLRFSFWILRRKPHGKLRLPLQSRSSVSPLFLLFSSENHNNSCPDAGMIINHRFRCVGKLKKSDKRTSCHWLQTV